MPLDPGIKTGSGRLSGRAESLLVMGRGSIFGSGHRNGKERLWNIYCCIPSVFGLQGYWMITVDGVWWWASNSVVKGFSESEVRVPSEIYWVHCKGAAGETQKCLPPVGARNWASFMVHSGHPWVNVPPVWWLGLGVSLLSLPGPLTARDCWWFFLGGGMTVLSWNDFLSLRWLFYC